MKLILLNIKNLTPYLLLISLYFIFINIEARKELTNYKLNTRTNKIDNNQSNPKENNLRISIPVIQYSE